MEWLDRPPPLRLPRPASGYRGLFALTMALLVATRLAMVAGVRLRADEIASPSAAISRAVHLTRCTLTRLGHRRTGRVDMTELSLPRPSLLASTRIPGRHRHAILAMHTPGPRKSSLPVRRRHGFHRCPIRIAVRSGTLDCLPCCVGRATAEQGRSGACNTQP